MNIHTLTPLKNNAPLWPQLKPGVPLWSNGKQSFQSPRRPGADWFLVGVFVKAAA